MLRRRKHLALASVELCYLDPATIDIVEIALCGMDEDSLFKSGISIGLQCYFKLEEYLLLSGPGFWSLAVTFAPVFPCSRGRVRLPLVAVPLHSCADGSKAKTVDGTSPILCDRYWPVPVVFPCPTPNRCRRSAGGGGPPVPWPAI